MDAIRPRMEAAIETRLLTRPKILGGLIAFDEPSLKIVKAL